MQNKQKICKIIEEFSLFILEKGVKNINIDIKRDSHQSTLVFTCDKLEEEIKKFILNRITNGRIFEVEQYGWELIGEGSVGDDLDIINALIDRVSYEEVGSKSVIRMVRDES